MPTQTIPYHQTQGLHIAYPDAKFGGWKFSLDHAQAGVRKLLSLRWGDGMIVASAEGETIERAKEVIDLSEEVHKSSAQVANA
jgi:hypothetical protein